MWFCFCFKARIDLNMFIGKWEELAGRGGDKRWKREGMLDEE